MASNVLWFEEMAPNMCFSLNKWRPIWSSLEKIRTKSDPKIFRARLGNSGKNPSHPKRFVCSNTCDCYTHYLRLYILENINQGNLGIVRCRSRTSEAVWWLRLSLEVEEIVKNAFFARNIWPISESLICPVRGLHDPGKRPVPICLSLMGSIIWLWLIISRIGSKSGHCVLRWQQP